MASSFNIKSVHREGKAELKIGIDENAKIIDGIGKEVIIKNEDGTPAILSNLNINCIPENANENNKLVTEEDLRKMVDQIQKAIQSTNDTLEALNQLASIVGTDDSDDSND